jgi:hypothetical protein
VAFVPLPSVPTGPAAPRHLPERGGRGPLPVLQYEGALKLVKDGCPHAALPGAGHQQVRGQRVSKELCRACLTLTPRLVVVVGQGPSQAAGRGCDAAGGAGDDEGEARKSRPDLLPHAHRIGEDCVRAVLEAGH